MKLRSCLGSLSTVVCVVAWSVTSRAAPAPRFHLGLETAIWQSTSTSADVTGTKDGTSTTVNVVSSSKTFGFPGATALSLGYLLGENIDLGTRFGYASNTTKLGGDATAPETEISSYSVSPYLAYVSGSYSDTARFTCGLMLGLGSSTTKTTKPSSGTGVNAVEGGPSEDTVSTTNYGGFLGVRIFPSRFASIDPMLMLSKSSQSTKFGSGVDAKDVDLSGTAILLNVGLSLWLGGQGAPAEAQGNDAKAEPAAASAGAEPEAAAVAASPAAVANGTAAAPADAAASKPKKDRIALPLGDGRAVVLIARAGAAEPKLTLVLRDASETSTTHTCRKIGIHVPNQEDVVLDATLGNVAGPDGRIPILKAALSVEQAKLLINQPGAVSAYSSDRNLNVCGSQWDFSEEDRNRIKAFLDALE